MKNGDFANFAGYESVFAREDKANEDVDVSIKLYRKNLHVTPSFEYMPNITALSVQYLFFECLLIIF